jgi:pimeloyl-ACP methyl ester carboxylesterase
MRRHDQQIALPDGRMLGYCEYGEPEGRPVFYFHGTPSARVEWELFGSDELARRLNVRIIAVDRPGMGLSDLQPGRRIRDWPADIGALADHLHLEHFGILGYSGGTLYATVCALAMPQRLISVILAAAVGPFDKPELVEGIPPQNLQFLFTSREKPWLARLVQRLMNLVIRIAPRQAIAQALRTLPEPDRAILSQPHMQQGFVNMVRESMRSGPRGIQVDTALMVSPWDFDPADIPIPVHLWKGAKDQNAPLAMAQYLDRVIPHSHLIVCPDEGHLSIMAHHLEDMLRTSRE